jgi:hypothetical protein
MAKPSSNKQQTETTVAVAVAAPVLAAGHFILHYQRSAAFTVWTEEGAVLVARPALRMGRSRAFTVWTEEGVDLPVHGPVLTVIAGMPSRAHVRCSLAGRQDLICDVRNAEHFRRGMMIYGAREREDMGGGRLWTYAGPLPRRAGKW